MVLPVRNLSSNHLNAWQLLKLIWRANEVQGSGKLLRRWLRQVTYVIRLLPYMPQIRLFLQATENPFLQEELKNSLTPLRSISRPYVHSGWLPLDRMRVIQGHYQILSHANYHQFRFSPSQYWDCVTKEIADSIFVVKIDKADWMRPEGELVLSVFWGIHRIYALAFSLQTTDAGRVFQIGALQGWQNEKAKDLYAELTTCMHGLRPRDLMVNLAQMLAITLNCNSVWGIADSCHHTNSRGNADKKHSIYDDIWSENGGVLNDKGFFVMPAVLRKKDFVDIASKKRGLYRRRYELLDDLQLKIQNAFDLHSVDFREH